MTSHPEPRHQWIVLMVKVPNEPSRHRVAVWRELRRTGAVQLGQGSWALPDTPAFAAAVTRLIDLVGDQEGEVLVLQSTAHDDGTDTRVRQLYDDARRAEWIEFQSECDKCAGEIAREIEIEKFTLAELDEEEQNVDRLRRWHRELIVRDVFSIEPAAVRSQLDACVALLETFTGLVYDAVGLS